MIYLLGLALLGGLLLTGNYVLNHSLDTDDIKTSECGFLLPTASDFPTTGARDHDDRFRLIDDKGSEEARISLHGIFLPNGIGYLESQKKNADETFTSRYIPIGKTNGKDLKESRIKKMYYKRGFSLAGDHIEHYIKLSKVEFIDAEKAIIPLKDKMLIGDLHIQSLKVYVNIASKGIVNAPVVEQPHNPQKPYQFVLVREADERGADALYILQEGKIHTCQLPQHRTLWSD